MTFAPQAERNAQPSNLTLESQASFCPLKQKAGLIFWSGRRIRKRFSWQLSYSCGSGGYPIMNRIVITIVLLSLSNVFMTFAWYGHLRNLAHKPWIIAALVSWGIALFEYLLQVPANRIGHSVLPVGQLKILQEVITLLIFVPFSLLYLKEKLSLDYLWAGLCLLGAVFFIFRSRLL